MVLPTICFRSWRTLAYPYDFWECCSHFFKTLSIAQWLGERAVHIYTFMLSSANMYHFLSTLFMVYRHLINLIIIFNGIDDNLTLFFFSSKLRVFIFFQPHDYFPEVILKVNSYCKRNHSYVNTHQQICQYISRLIFNPFMDCGIFKICLVSSEVSSKASHTLAYLFTSFLNEERPSNHNSL